MASDRQIIAIARRILHGEDVDVSQLKPVEKIMLERTLNALEHGENEMKRKREV